MLMFVKSGWEKHSDRTARGIIGQETRQRQNPETRRIFHLSLEIFRSSLKKIGSGNDVRKISNGNWKPPNCSAPPGRHVIAQRNALGTVEIRPQALKGRDTQPDDFALAGLGDVLLNHPARCAGLSHPAPSGLSSYKPSVRI